MAALTPQQQNEVMNLIDSLRVQLSAYEAGKQWTGCVDSGMVDLSTNKQYRSGFGKE